MEPQRSSITLPSAIIIAAAIIAIAIIWVYHPVRPPAANTSADANLQGSQISMAPVTAADHIYGNPNAPIKIVEYSDPSCPYCKMFNPTMVQLMTAYGPSGNVAWVYRAFPLDKPNQDGKIAHPNAGRESQALECAGVLGGNDKFWAYEKAWYEAIPIDGAGRSADADQKQILDVAASVGLDQVAMNDCIASGRTKNKVEQQYLDGVNARVPGTPYSIIITPSGSKIPVEGAQPYSTLKAAIDAFLPSTKTQ